MAYADGAGDSWAAVLAAMAAVVDDGVRAYAVPAGGAGRGLEVFLQVPPAVRAEGVAAIGDALRTDRAGVREEQFEGAVGEVGDWVGHGLDCRRAEPGAQDAGCSRVKAETWGLTNGGGRKQ